MAFRIAARTILHLGADLISSDAVALYELVKNAIDAKSKSGVTIAFDIVISQSDFESVMASIESEQLTAKSLGDLKADMFSRILPTAPNDLRAAFERALDSAKSVAEFRRNATTAYRECNRILVLDEGHGMSRIDLEEVYLTIGTPHRTRSVREAVLSHKSGSDARTPYLGEKGIGRLSVMRLGWAVRVETATADDEITNILEIDWKRFEEAFDAPASSVELIPQVGEKKKKGVSFTRIIITDIRASWSRDRLMEIARDQIARMMDPFSWDSPRRFPIRLAFNGIPIEQARTVARDLLSNAHGQCEGDFTLHNNVPILKATFTSSLLGGDKTTLTFDVSDLLSMSGLKHSRHPSSTLRTLGPFKFDLYWFNRQRLRAIEGVGDREAVRGLVRAWAGVSLFRDGYRVLPYGDEGDDWLGLDREAFAAAGYKLNTKQIIGRVRVSRLANPKLLDQTNRQGLVDCPEKSILIQLLKDLISHWWHDYLDDATRAQKAEKGLAFDSVKEIGAVDDLEKRARDSIKTIRRSYTGDESALQQVKDAFLEIKEAHERAVARINTIEEQKERLTQLAGIGLMIEVIAHELTRATEATQKTLKTIAPKRVDSETASAFRVLASQIKVIQKRLQTLEPLSITARQRRSMMNVSKIVSYILDAHREQFIRHNVVGELSKASDRTVEAFLIEGHVVQILENLINNSIYWLDVEKKERPSFAGSIKIEVLDEPPRIRYSDNGPGIPKNREEPVFEPFFSTKVSTTSRRQGLGLYIARQNAEMLGGNLTLTDIGSVHEGRYNTFELELRTRGGDE